MSPAIRHVPEFRGYGDAESPGTHHATGGGRIHMAPASAVVEEARQRQTSSAEEKRGKHRGAMWLLLS